MENTIKNEKWWRMGHCKDVQTPSRTDTFPVMRGRPFAFQNKGCCWVTDIDAGRGIGTDNRSARGGSLKQIQSDLRGVLEQRTPVWGHLGWPLRLMSTDVKHRDCEGARKNPVQRHYNRWAAPFCALGESGVRHGWATTKKKKYSHHFCPDWDKNGTVSD